MTEIAIRFQNVSKQFTLHRERPRSFQEVFLSWRRHRRQKPEQFWVLRDLTFDVAKNETLGVIGSNGAGKSTILKLIAGIIVPTRGKIDVSGRVSSLLELGAGFHPDLTGRENVFLYGSLLGLSRATMRQRFDEIVAFSELDEFIDLPVKTYSSGMYLRLAFAVAIHVDPEVLLIDEILAVGDSAFQRKCTDRIYEMRRQGVTILLVSHSLDSVIRLCSRAIWLEDGRALADGPAREVVQAYLDRVNEIDRARLTRAKARSGDGDVTDRTGSGEIRVTDVEFLNGQGRPAQVFRTGDPLVVRIHYWADEPVERPVFGLGLYRDDDLHVTGPNTKTGGLTIPVADGRGSVDYSIAELPLMAGRYELTVTVYDDTISHQYDGVYRAYSFSVQPRTPWDRLGVVELAARWLSVSVSPQLESVSLRGENDDSRRTSD